MEIPPPILITGAARSGTSMVAGVINMCGAFGGVMRGPTPYNRRGMFENTYIVDQILKPYLRELGLDPMGQYPLPDVREMPIPSNLRDRVTANMIKEGYRSGPWMYKGAKMCLTWPMWHYAFPNAKWIIVRRKTSEIVESCEKTKFMRAFKRAAFRKAVGVRTEREGWLWWVHQHERRFVEMITEGLNCKVIWPHRMVIGDYRQAYEVMEWLGLRWRSEVLSFIDPKLWKARKPQ